MFNERENLARQNQISKKPKLSQLSRNASSAPPTDGIRLLFLPLPSLLLIIRLMQPTYVGYDSGEPEERGGEQPRSDGNERTNERTNLGFRNSGWHTDWPREREKEERDTPGGRSFVRSPDLKRADGRLAFYSRDIFAPLPVGLSLSVPRSLGRRRRRRRGDRGGSAQLSSVSESGQCSIAHQSDQNRTDGRTDRQTDQRGLARSAAPPVIGDVVATRGMSSGKIVQLLGHSGNNRRKEEREERIHRSRAQRHVCVLCSLSLSLSLYIHVRSLSLECQPCHRFAFRNCLPPPSLPPSSSSPECTERILSQRAVR